MSPSYEDGLVAGMMDFLHGGFSDDIYCATDDFGRGYACSCPSPIDHPPSAGTDHYMGLSEGEA